MRRRKYLAECWRDAEGDIDKAMQLAEQRYKDGTYKFVGTLLIFLQVAWLLFQFWQAFRVSDPGDEPLEGEPDDSDMD